jgi:OPA family sugar phosphate sensor protein UhpC-like MFS transporter
LAGGILGFFATGPDRPLIEDDARVGAMYRSHRVRIMLAIIIGYGVIYTCRLALGVVKKPLIDAGIFTPTELGLIGSALF